MSTNKKSPTSPSSPVQQSPVQQSLGEPFESPSGSEPSGAAVVDWFMGDGAGESGAHGAAVYGTATDPTQSPKSPGKTRPTTCPDPRPVPPAPTYCMPPLPDKPSGGGTDPKQEPPKPTPPVPTGPYRPPVDLPTDPKIPDIVVVPVEPTDPTSPTDPCVDDTQTPDQQGKLPPSKPPVPTDPTPPTGGKTPTPATRDLLTYARTELEARKRELLAAEAELARAQAAVKDAQAAAQACGKELEALNKKLEDVRRALGGAATPADAASLMEQLEQLTVKIRKAESQKQMLTRAVKEAEAAYALAQSAQGAAKTAYEAARIFLDEETRASAERTRLADKARAQIKIIEQATEILKAPSTTGGSGKSGQQQQQQVPPDDGAQCPVPPVDQVVTEGRAAMKAAKEWIAKVFPDVLLRRAAERSVIPLGRIAERRQDERTAFGALLAHMQKDLTDNMSGSRMKLADALRWLAEFADHAKEQQDQAIAAFKAVASAPLPSEAVLRRIFDSTLKTAAQRAIELEVRRDSARAAAELKKRELEACLRGSAIYAELTQRMASLAAIEQVVVNAARVMDQDTLNAGAPLWRRYYDELLSALTKAGIRATAESLLNQYSQLRGKVLEAEIALESPELVRRSDAELRQLERERQDHLLLLDRVLLNSGNVHVLMDLINELNRQRVNATLPYPDDERSKIAKDVAELEAKLEQAINAAVKPAEVRDALRKLRTLNDKLSEARQLRLSVPSDIDRWEVAVPEEAWRNLWTYHEGCRKLHALSRTDVVCLLNWVSTAVCGVIDATDAAGRYLRERPLLEAMHRYREQMVKIAEEFKASDVIAAMRGDY